MFVLGIKKVNFQADDGRTIDGVTLYGSYDADGVDGVATDKAFVSSDKFNGVEVKVGDKVELLYNKYGKVAAIRHLR